MESRVEALRATGHGAAKAAEIDLDARRGVRFARTWLAIARLGRRAEARRDRQ